MSGPLTSVRLFTTIPAFGRLGSEYRQTVRRAAQTSEAAGFVRSYFLAAALLMFVAPLQRSAHYFRI